MKLELSKYFLPVFFTASVCYTQTDTAYDNVKFFQTDKLILTEQKISKEEVRNLLPDNVSTIYENLFLSRQNQKFEFNIISSFGSNINFGGFWEKYAVLNFSPNVAIQPLEFINIYANQTLSCLVPLTSIKENFKSLFLQSAAILAIDNSVKFLFRPRNWISDAAAYIMKNLIISFVIKPLIEETKGTDNQILKYESFYYSVGVKF